MKDIILESLDQVVNAIGDPVTLVYQRIFERHPEMEALFILDKTGAARGHMLAEVLDCVVDFCDGDNYASNFLASERMNHEGLGVPVDVFGSFLDVVIEVFRDAVGSDWSKETEAAWTHVREGLRQ